MPVLIESVPKLHQLPTSLTRENAVEIELEQNVLIFRAAKNTQSRADGRRIISKTSIGRATAELLKLNRERILFLREAGVAVKRHPPIDDLN